MADGRSTQGAFKWSRNLREESLSETNRLKLIEKQKQLLESKRQRQPQVTATSSSVSRLYKGTSIPGTNVSSNERLIDVADEKEPVTGFVNEALVPDSLDTSPPSSAKSGKSTAGPNKKVPQTPKKVQGTSSDSDSFDSSPENMSVMGGTSSPDLSPGDFGDANRAKISTKSEQRHSLSKNSGSSDNLPLSQSFNPLTTITTNAELLQFANRPVSIDKLYQCTIIRDKRGLDQSFYPTYFMYLQAIISRNGNYTLNENRKSQDTPFSEKSKLTDELKPSSPGDVAKSIFTTSSSSATASSSSSSSSSATATTTAATTNSSGGTRSTNQNITTGNRQVFLMCGRRRKKSRYYLISLDPFDISKSNSIGKLKYNLIGTQFTSFRRPGPRQNIQDATIVYDANILGFKGPRKMTVFFADPSLQETSPVPRNKGIIQLKNKTPVWNEDSQSYVLNFHGRVTQASVKNFQLVEATTDDSSCSFAESMLQQQPNQTWITSQHHQSQSELSLKDAFKKNEKSANSEYAPTQPVSSPTHSLPLDSEVVMQFGRVSDKEFTCDIRYPLSPFQAFAIALSSFDSKLACE